MTKKHFISSFFALFLLCTPALAVAPLVWALGVSASFHVGLFILEWTDENNAVRSIQVNVQRVTTEQEAAYNQPVNTSGSSPYCTDDDGCIFDDINIAAQDAWDTDPYYSQFPTYSISSFTNSFSMTQNGLDYWQQSASILDGGMVIGTFSWLYYLNTNAIEACPTGMVEDLMNNCVFELPDNNADIYITANNEFRADLDNDNSALLPGSFLSINGELRWDTSSDFGSNEASLKIDNVTNDYRITESNSNVPVVKVGGGSTTADITQIVSIDGGGSGGGGGGGVNGTSSQVIYNDGSSPSEGDVVGDVTIGAGTDGPDSSDGVLDPGSDPDPDPGGGGNCGGPDEPICDVRVVGDVSVDESGTPSAMVSSEYDSILAATGIDAAIANIGNIDSGMGPDKLDFGIESYFPAAGTCSDYSYTWAGHSVVIPLASSPYMSTLRDLFGWFVYILTALYLYQLATTHRST